jgi:hypothetical protein
MDESVKGNEAIWNYIVRLYQPHQEIVDGKWKFPTPQPVM